MDSEQFNQIMRAMQSQNEIQRIQMLSMQQQITKINSKKNNDLEDGEVETESEPDRESLWKEEYYFVDFLNEFVKIKNTTFSQEKIDKEIIPALLKVIRVIELGSKRYVVLKLGFADKENPIGNFIEVLEFNKFKSEYPITNGFGYRVPLKTSKGGR